MKNMFKKGNQKFKHVKVLAYNAIKFMIKTKKLFHLIKNYLSKSFYHFLKNTRIILVFRFTLSHVHLWILIVSIYRKTIGQSLCRLHRYSVTLKLNDNLDVSIITSRSRLRTLSPRCFFLCSNRYYTDRASQSMNWYYTSREKQTEKPFNRSIDNMLAKFFIAFRFDKCINFITVEKLLSVSSINNPEKLNVRVYGIYKK